MKIRTISSLSVSLVSISSLVIAMELVERSAVSTANDLKLYTNHHDFYVEDENAAYRVEKHNMNPLLRAIAQHKALEKFVGDGYIRINKDDQGTYSLAAKVRGNGGGPVAGACTYWGVKITGYCALIAGIISTQGELILHAAELSHCIEVAATTAGTIVTLTPTP